MFNKKVAYWTDQARNPEPPFDGNMEVVADEMIAAQVALQDEPRSVLSGPVGLLPLAQADLDEGISNLAIQARSRHARRDRIGRMIYSFDHVGIKRYPIVLQKIALGLRGAIRNDAVGRGVIIPSGTRVLPELRLGWFIDLEVNSRLKPLPHRISEKPVFEYVFSSSKQRRGAP